MMKIHSTIFIILLVVFSNCRSHRENIMLQKNGLEGSNQKLTQDSTFTINPFDKLRIDIYTKAGELLIDPERKLAESNKMNAGQQRESIYQVNKDGVVKLPMIGNINLSGLSASQAEDSIAEKYTEFYDKLYVTVEFKNKRVIILGSTGGKVFPLENENTTLIEIIAMAGGIDKNGNATNVRLIRGEQVIVANLSTVEGYLKSNYTMEHGDIIYIEPIRRPFTETVREIAPGVSILTGLISMAVLIINITN